MLEVEQLSTADRAVSGRDVSRVRAGEIVGLAGLVGSGKSEVARACFGLEPIAAGRVRFDGRGRDRRQPARRCSSAASSTCRPTGAAEGLVMMRGVRENITLPSLDLRRLLVRACG